MDSKQMKILLINDLPGVGKVALSAMVPILSAMGFCVHTLPTAIISNTLDFGLFEIMDTTSYMEKTVLIWQQLEFTFDCICTGFINSPKQIPIIEQIIQQNPNRYIVVDPVMADNGQLYNGLTPQTIDCMNALIGKADLITPNITEALLLTNAPLHIKDGATTTEIENVLYLLRLKGAKSVIITSVKELETNIHYVYGYDHKRQEIFKVFYTFVDVNYPGTGDIFTSILTATQLQGHTLEYGVKKAVSFLNYLLQNFLSWDDSREGLLIESNLSVLTADI